MHKPNPASTRTPSKCKAPLPELPPELWICIHRLATAHLSPLAAYDDDDEGLELDDPLNERDMQRFLRAVRSLARVSRLWNALTRELLFSHVHVNARFATSLAPALADPSTAAVVRAVRLSTVRFDHNAALLAQCARATLLVQPEYPRAGRLYVAPAEPPLHLPALTRLHWVESAWSAPLLVRVLAATPALTHLTLASARTIGALDDPPPVFPAALASLRTLDIVLARTSCVHALLGTADLRALARLSIEPEHLSWAAFPVLPALHTLTLVLPLAGVGGGDTGAADRIPFAALAACCPALRELRYDARCLPVLPETGLALAALVCVRLRLPKAANRAGGVSRTPATTTNVAAERDARLLSSHLRLFLAPPLHGVERVVLEGGRSGGGGNLVALTEMLRARGCIVEGS
ncbi:hypothetical protein DFH09DRAFT_1303285 [Mycena vulgaris]|nr:hypothetical protein DFH09DRAFT_1303285 [Mycena vulgaris]